MLPRGSCTRLFEAFLTLIPKEEENAKLNVTVSNRRKNTRENR